MSSFVTKKLHKKRGQKALFSRCENLIVVKSSFNNLSFKFSDWVPSYLILVIVNIKPNPPSNLGIVQSFSFPIFSPRFRLKVFCFQFSSQSLDLVREVGVLCVFVPLGVLGCPWKSEFGELLFLALFPL